MQGEHEFVVPAMQSLAGLELPPAFDAANTE